MPRGASKISLRELARRLELHSSTVSRALNGHPAINPKTVERVRKSAKKWGYVPNPDVKMAMQRVRTSSDETLQGIMGVLNFHPNDEAAQKELKGGRLYRGIMERAKVTGWKADVIHVGEGSGLSPERLRTILMARNINGVLLLPAPFKLDDPHLNLEGFTVVATSGTWNQIPGFEHIPSVTPAHWRNVMTLLHYLKERGFRRPLMHIHTGIEARHMQTSLGAFLMSQSRGDWEVNIPVDMEGLEKRRYEKLFKKYQPDVVIGPDIFVKDFLEQELKYSIPRDCSFIAYARRDERVAGFDQKFEVIGAAAVDFLTGMLIQRQGPSGEVARSLIVEGEIAPGPTLECKSA